MRRASAAALIGATLALGLAARAAEPPRATVWDLVLGAPAAAQPPAAAFRRLACGGNGGPPLRALAGWSDVMRCAPEPSGLREVAVEYDDEAEYVARARGELDRLPRVAGTTELAFPVVVSGLFDAAGILKAIRLVSDPRPDYRPDQGDAELRGRRDAYKLASFLAARFAIEPQRDCVAEPPAPGESAVGAVFVKQRCEKRADGRRITLESRYLRKAGQSDRDPTLPTRLTRGQFDSETRLEIALD
jgi:hypothetical protein